MTEKSQAQARQTAENKSFVISVNLYKGCYRHVQIAQDATLENLSDAILQAFSFDDDHMHAFFMDNVAWSRADCNVLRPRRHQLQSLPGNTVAPSRSSSQEQKKKP